MDTTLRKKLLTRSLLVISGVIFVYLFFNYSFATFTSDSKNKLSRAFITNSNGETVFKTELIPNESKLVVIKRGSKLVTIRSDDNESRSPLQFRPLWSGSYKVSIKPQIVIKKMGTGSLSCGIETKTKNFYSYRCNGGSDVLRYSTEDDFPTNQVVVSSTNINLLSPAQYNSDILSVIQRFPDDPYRLARVKLQQNIVVEQVNIPKKLGIDNANELALVTNVTNREDERFLLIDGIKNKLHIFSGIKDTNPKTVDLQNDLEKGELLTHACSLGDSFIVCKYGRASTAIDGEVNEQVVKAGSDDTTLSIYSFTGDLLSRRKLKEDGVVTKVIVADSVIAALTSNRVLVTYKYSDSKFSRINSSAGVDNISASKKYGILALEGTSIYATDTSNAQTQLLVRSSNLRVSDFSSGYDYGGFTAFINNQNDSPLSAYILTSQPHEGLRVEDTLPTSRNSLIRELDYTNDTLYIKVGLTSYTSDQETGEFTVDEAEYNATKNEVLRQLNKTGFSKKFKKIVFSY